MYPNMLKKINFYNSVLFCSNLLILSNKIYLVLSIDIDEDFDYILLQIIFWYNYYLLFSLNLNCAVTILRKNLPLKIFHIVFFSGNFC